METNNQTKNLTCIGCPMGCSVTVTMENNEVTSVTGNTCKRGDDYARKEVTHPTRIVTSSVRVIGGRIPMVSLIEIGNGVGRDCERGGIPLQST